MNTITQRPSSKMNARSIPQKRIERNFDRLIVLTLMSKVLTKSEIAEKWLKVSFKKKQFKQNLKINL